MDNQFQGLADQAPVWRRTSFGQQVFQSGQGVRRRVRMDDRQPAGMTRVPGLEGFEGDGALTHLADDDPVPTYGNGFARGAGLAAHISCPGRPGACENGEQAAFFGPVHDGADAGAATEGWGRDRHHFRFIISPEHGDRISDLKDYKRTVLSPVGDGVGEPGLEWIAVCHERPCPSGSVDTI